MVATLVSSCKPNLRKTSERLRAAEHLISGSTENTVSRRVEATSRAAIF